MRRGAEQGIRQQVFHDYLCMFNLHRQADAEHASLPKRIEVEGAGRDDRTTFGILAENNAFLIGCGQVPTGHCFLPQYAL